MWGNSDNLNRARQLAEKDRERKTFQTEPTQGWRSGNGKTVGSFANVLEGGRYFGQITRTEPGLLPLVVRYLLQVFGLGLREKPSPHLSKACALR